ncbi:hypothetical protein ACF1BN_07965 [Streptomyces sp. NPDC014861]|uniref:hypothetical protein n=1 Tax=Streptomyces sp. NPDC014861 TaxID=3364923 RepID=UPI0036FE48C3
MAVQDIRSAARLIGRRNALRYLAIGAAATLVAACTGETRKSAAGSGTTPAPTDAPTGTAPATTAAPTATGSPSPSPTSVAPEPAPTGVVARAFDAFIRGDWTVESTTPGRETARGRATVMADGGGNGGFSIVWEGTSGPVTWSGGWLLRGGHLGIDVYDAPEDVDRLSGGQALTVPGQVREGVSLVLPWQPPGHGGTSDGQQLKVSYRNDVLRIVHTERGGSESVHVCTRTA